MSYRADMTSADMDRQLQLLKVFPEIVDKHFRGLMAKNVAVLFSKIKGTIPTATGNARSKFRKALTGKGINMQAKVGWWGKDAPWYINVVEYGSGPHPITYVPKLGVSFVKRPHPGISGVGFMAAGYSALKPAIDADLQRAGDAVARELAL